MKKTCLSLILLTLISFSLGASASAAKIGRSLQSQLADAADAADVGLVIVAFETGGANLGDVHLNVLRSLGLNGGATLGHLGMVAVPATAGQVRALAARPEVRSIWANDRLQYYMHQARVVAGVDRARTDAAFTAANGGFPVSGKGNFSVLINDSGIDARHDDLRLGDHVIQNVQLVVPGAADIVTGGFTPLLAIENVPNNDTTGHGTHCAGIVGGSGQSSGGLYQGVAPGARLIGVGSGAAILVLNALGGFEYALANQARYNIRVISNSFGPLDATLDFDPDDPVSIASKVLYDRSNITASRRTPAASPRT